MITLLIFYLHTVAAATMFTIYWQEEGLKGGLAALGFMVVIFSVGWPMATIVLKLFISPAGMSAWLDRDTLSLVLLTVVETAGGWYYLGRRGRRAVHPPGG